MTAFSITGEIVNLALEKVHETLSTRVLRVGLAHGIRPLINTCNSSKVLCCPGLQVLCVQSHFTFYCIRAQMEQLNAATRLLNMKYVVTHVNGSDADYGYQLPDGTWTSYLGALQRNKIDLFVGAAVDNAERRRHFQLLDTGV